MTTTPPPARPVAARGARPRALDRSASVWAFLLVTLLVWVGRIRNAVGDASLDGSGRVGPLTLSASFVVLALVAGGLLVASHRRHSLGRGAARAVGVLAVWTIGVWIVRAVDIALLGDHEVGFVVVHLVLAAVSVVLAALALAVVGPPWRASAAAV
jgi:hypothetical protein